MRLAYLSADRIELQLARKELVRAMAEPTTADVEALKRPRTRFSHTHFVIVLVPACCRSCSSGYSHVVTH